MDGTPGSVTIGYWGKNCKSVGARIGKLSVTYFVANFKLQLHIFIRELFYYDGAPNRTVMGLSLLGAPSASRGALAQ